MTPEQNFRAVAPAYMAKFIQDTTVDIETACAVFGNAGTESLGLTVLQEIRPTVKNSRGGFGWFQWTGPRRRAYEAWCKAYGFDGTEPDANYGFLLMEVQSAAYAGALRKTLAAIGLENKVVAFEKYYEGAGTPNMNSRIHWARVALDAFNKEFKL